MSFNIKTEKHLTESAIRRIIAIGISLRDAIQAQEMGLISDYDPTVTYKAGMAVYYDDYLWKCKYTTTGDFDKSKWELIGDDLTLITKDDIKAMLGLTKEQLDTLAKIIDDSTIVLDHSWSSSKVYTEIQNAIQHGEQFTLSKLANAMTASFEIASSTSDMTATNILYLLSTGTNTYDIYALINSTPTVIASTTIDLSDYVKKTDLVDYLKTTDADAKYATITALGTHTTDTDIHTSATEKASYALKANITDLINASSTSDQMASAKGVYNNLLNIFNNSYGLYTSIVKNGEDLNSVVTNTFLSVGHGAINSPYNGNFFGISTTFYNNTKYTMQILVSANENETTTKNRIIWIRHQFNGIWTNWFHITPTSTSDIGYTVLSSESSSLEFTNADSHFDYCIHNGTCFVNVWSIKCINPGAEIILSTKLPVGICNIVQQIHTNASSAQYTIVGQLYTNGNILKLNVPQSFERGYCSFSYPVV